MQEAKQQAEAHPSLSRSWELLSQSGRAAFEHKHDSLQDGKRLGFAAAVAIVVGLCVLGVMWWLVV